MACSAVSPTTSRGVPATNVKACRAVVAGQELEDDAGHRRRDVAKTCVRSLERDLRLTLSRDVGERRDHAVRGVAFARDRVGRDRQPGALPVRPMHAEEDTATGEARCAGDLGGHRLRPHGYSLRRHQRPSRVDALDAPQLVMTEPEDALRGRVAEGDRPRGVVHRDAFAHRSEDGRVALLARRVRGLGLVDTATLEADVREGDEHPFDLSRRAAERHRVHAEPHPCRLVPGKDTQDLSLHRDAGPQDAPERLLGAAERLAVGVDDAPAPMWRRGDELLRGDPEHRARGRVHIRDHRVRRVDDDPHVEEVEELVPRFDHWLL